jgi:hypothetical protein
MPTLSVKLVRRVMVVTEDVFEPMRNSLYVDLVDGTSDCLFKKREMKRFIADLEAEHPQLGAAVKAAVENVGEICGEQVFDVDGD